MTDIAERLPEPNPERDGLHVVQPELPVYIGGTATRGLPYEVSEDGVSIAVTDLLDIQRVAKHGDRLYIGRAAIRQVPGVSLIEDQPKPVITTHAYGAVVLDRDAKSVSIEDNDLKLPPVLYDLFRTLADNEGTVLSKRQINDAVSQLDYEEGGGARLRVSIQRLRDELGGYRWLVQNVKYHGYKMPIEKPPSSDDREH